MSSGLEREEAVESTQKDSQASLPFRVACMRNRLRNTSATIEPPTALPYALQVRSLFQKRKRGQSFGSSGEWHSSKSFGRGGSTKSGKLIAHILQLLNDRSNYQVHGLTTTTF